MPENNKDSNDSSKDAKSTQNSSISFFSAVGRSPLDFHIFSAWANFL